MLVDGLRRALHGLRIIASGRRQLGRGVLLRVYLALLGRQFVANRRGHLGGSVSLFGHRIAYADINLVVFNFEEVFIGEDYALRPDAEAELIFDCGANIGLSVLHAKLCHPQARIVAFEPAPDTAALLRSNVGGLPGVTVEERALGASPGRMTLHAPPGAPASASATTFPYDGMEAVATVEVVPLSLFVVEPVALLKLDIEGRELEVVEELAAAGKLALVDTLVAEVHTHPAFPQDTLPRLLALLREHGFDAALATARGADKGPRDDETLLIRAVRRSS